ncbi:hypothetical protein BH11BAC2_BH11BAC2_22540 [soil metagenome]
MKKKLLLLHGALGSATSLQILNELLSEYYEVYAYDFPGHGGKPFPEESLKMPVLTRHLHEYIREFHLTGCAVFGYSMGGYAALWLESKEQGTFSQIMTLATKFEWTPEIADKEIALLNPEKMEQKIPSFVNSLQEMHAPNDWKKVVLETALLLKHLGTNHLTSDDFGNINCPVRIALGDVDQMVSIEETLRVFKEFPKSSLLVMPSTAHALERVDLSYLKNEIHRFIH